MIKYINQLWKKIDSNFLKLKNKLDRIEEKIDSKIKISPNFIEIIDVIKKNLFYLGLTGVLIFESAHYSSLIIIKYPYSEILGNISLILLISKIVLTKEKFWKYILYFTLIYLAYICENNIGISYHMTFIVVTMIASRGIDIKKIIKYVFSFNCLLILVQMYCYVMFKMGYMDFLEIEKEVVLYRNGLLRHTFFFFHPNTFSNYLFWTYMMFVYLNFDNKKKRKLIVLLAIFLAVFTYVFPSSRNAFIFFIISIPLLYLYNNKKVQKNKVFLSLNELSFVLSLLVSFILLIFYDTNGMFGIITGWIDKLLSGRIWLGKSYLIEYGISLLGNFMTASRNFNATGVATVVIDNWYYYMLIRLGLIFTLFNFIIFFKGACHFTKTKDYAKLYVLIIFILYNCIEIVGTIPQISFPYFFLGMLL